MLFNKKVSFISLAEQQQLEVVRAMIYSPKLLILDESTAALLEPEWLFEEVEKFVEKKTTLQCYLLRIGLREAKKNV